jgi:hypothetical protein
MCMHAWSYIQACTCIQTTNSHDAQRADMRGEILRERSQQPDTTDGQQQETSGHLHEHEASLEQEIESEEEDERELEMEWEYE